MIDLKKGVTLRTLCPSMIPALKILEEIHDAFGIPFVITSTNDGAHIQSSHHWEGHAFDFRENAPFNTRVLAEAKKRLPAHYRVILEDMLPPHFHVEIRVLEVPK